MRKEAAPRHRARRRELQPSVVPWPDTEPLISRQPRLAGSSRFRTTGQVSIQSETKLRRILLIAKRTEGDCIDRRALSLSSAKPMQKALTAKGSLHLGRKPRTHSCGLTRRPSNDYLTGCAASIDHRRPRLRRYCKLQIKRAAKRTETTAILHCPGIRKIFR